MRFPLLLLALSSPAFAIDFEVGKTITRYAGAVDRAIPADLDGDGDIDLMTRERMSAAVTAYENTGQGRFERAMIWDSGSWDDLGDLADFDGDGLPDLLLKTAETVDGVRGHSLRIVFGAGFDGFGPREMALGFHPWFRNAVVADVDASALPDIVTYGLSLLDPGDGSSVERIITEPGSSDFARSDHTKYHWVDWTGDGLADLFVESAWWENLGGGRFSEMRQLPRPEPGTDENIGTITPLMDHRLPGGRGLLNVHTDYSRAFTLRLTLSVIDGGGQWVEADSIRIDRGNEYCKVPALFHQADGSLQAALVLGSFPKNWSRPLRFSRELVEFSVTLRNGKPALKLKSLVQNLSVRAMVALKTDMDRDGRDDLLLATGSTHDPSDDSKSSDEQLIYHPANGAGGYESRAVEITPVALREEIIELVDFERDGDQDLVTEAVNGTGGFRQISWWENLGGAGAFRRHVLLSATGENLRFLSAKDRNGDGKPDILALHHEFKSLDKAFRSIELSLSTRGSRRVNRTAYRQEDLTQPIRSDVGDWDGDGLDDVVMWDHLYSRPDYELIGTPVRWLKGLPGNRFAAPQPLGDSGWQTLYDADGDGDPDLVPLAGDYLYPELKEPYRWRENTGSGLPVWRDFPPVNDVRAEIEPAFADLDSDGQMDFVSAGTPLLSRGTGAFVEMPGIPPGKTWFHDLDGDGDPDAVVRLEDVGNTVRVANLVWLENPGGAVFSEAKILDVPNSSNWTKVHVGDLDGDGTLDIVASSPPWARPRIEWFRGK